MTVSADFGGQALPCHQKAACFNVVLMGLAIDVDDQGHDGGETYAAHHLQITITIQWAKPSRVGGWGAALSCSACKVKSEWKTSTLFAWRKILQRVNFYANVKAPTNSTKTGENRYGAQSV